VTSRNSNQVLMLDAQTGAVLKQAAVGVLPWGVAVNPSNNRLYVANFTSGDLYVLDATTLARITIASLGSGAEPAFIGVHPDSGRVLVAGHGRNQLWVLTPDGVIEHSIPTGGNGAWGLAVHPYLKRAYVGHRDSANVITFDGNNNWQPIAGQSITPCGVTGHPFALNFNPVNDRLYVACAPEQNVSQVKVYRASSGGLTLVASLAAGSGGPDGGGGIAINTATNNVFFTNSTSRSVTVIGSNPDRVVATVQAGADPFGAVADAFTGNIYIGNRAGNTVTVVTDNAYGADATAPKLTLSRQDGCEGLQITVTGRNFPVTPPRGTGHVWLRFNGVHVGAVAPNGQGSFSTTFTIPASRGGTNYVVAADLLTNWLQVGAPLRTPRTDGLPIIFIPGAGGSELRAEETFTFWSGLTEQHTFFENSILWLDGWAVWANLTGDPEYMDALALDLDGDSAHPDFFGGRPSRIKVGGPVRQVQVAWIVQDVYQGMINKLESLGYLENVLLFYYPYDWRKDWAHTDSDLAATIDAVLQTTQMD
ncbi:MAG: YncE family protein, partial [Anaerolineae bacterium]